MSNIKTKSFYIIVTVIVLFFPVLSGQYLLAQTEPVGRDNPFAKISRPSTGNPLSSLISSDAEEETPPLYMQTIMLKFLDAKSLMDAIKTMSSEYGNITYNQKNNSLIICDTKEHLEWIVGEIEKADKTPQQIMVEVVIIDVQLNDDTELGINWDIMSDKNYDIGYRQNFTDRLGSTIEDSTSIGNATAFNTIGSGGNFSVISGTIRNVLAMLQKKRNVEILASPRAMMVSGQSASIRAVEEIPYSEVSDTAAGGAGAITSTKFKDVGVTLQVSGKITDDNKIFLTIEAMQNVRTGASDTGVPLVDTREANTELLLQDGQIVVMGGLRRKETTDEVDQIPFLGDIPVLGFLFKYNNTIVRDTELIVFISPHIYKDNEPIPEDAMEKFREIKDRPFLSLSKETGLKAYRDELALYADKQNVTPEQLQEIISQCKQVESELKECRDRLEKRVDEQVTVNEQLEQNFAESKQFEDELVEYKIQIDNTIKEHSDINKQLESQINEGKQTEDELKNDYDLINKRLEEQASTIEKLQPYTGCNTGQSCTASCAGQPCAASGSGQPGTTYNSQAERDVVKNELLSKIEVLRNKKDENSTKELLLALASLDKILSEEIQETLKLSEDALAKQ